MTMDQDAREQALREKSRNLSQPSASLDSRLESRDPALTSVPAAAYPRRSHPLYETRNVVTDAVGTLPDVIIIGAMKCGTTSLHDYLNCHPEINMSDLKETNFFVQHQNWSKGLSWYRSNFSEPRKVIGESSPNYTRYPLFPGVPERMRMVVPNAKLLYCVRDPIKRMVSHYIHSYSLGRENRPFKEAMLDPNNNPYLLCSKYYYQLEQYLKYYSASQIKIVVLEEMEEDPLDTLENVFEFLGVDPTYEDSRFTAASRKMPPATQRRRSLLKSWMVRRKMRGVYWIERNAPWLFGAPLPKPQIDEALREALSAQLRDDVNALREFTGLELAHWKV